MITKERIDENTRMASNGTQKWFIKRVDGVDLWEIKTEKGPLPKQLEGRFTDPIYAYSQISNYAELKAKG